MKKPALTLVLVASCATTIAAEAPLDRIIACQSVTDRDQRLACFDREVAHLAQSRARTGGVEPAASPPPAVARAPSPRSAPPARAPAPAAPPAPAPAVAAPSFGEEQLDSSRRPGRDEADQELHARITRLQRVGPSAFAVTLDNGQVWRHEDQHLGSFLREGEAVTLRKGTLGSYRLTRDAGESRNWIRVTRIR